MKTPMKLITISDVHIGHQEVVQLRKEFEPFIENIHKVYKQCKKEKIHFGGVAVTGDLFDHQISMNSADAKFAMELVHEIASIVQGYGGYTILLKGTQSHDLNQLEMFNPFQEVFENFYIVNELAMIEIFDYSVLLIPEEYMKNQDEFYEEAFSDTYDIILGHGFFKFNCFSKNEVERSMPNMPIFDQEKIVDIGRITIFGHDHHHKSYRDKIYYNGSWSRLCHGEEDDKGALLLYIDENKTKVERIINSYAPSYKSVQLENLSKEKLTFETAVKSIKSIKEKEKIDYLKIKISSETIKSNPALVSLITTAFNTQYKRLNIVIESPPFSIKNGVPILLLEENSFDTEVNDIEEVEPKTKVNAKYSFLFDNSLEMDEKILQYISLKTDIDTDDITLDNIRDAISDTDN